MRTASKAIVAIVFIVGMSLLLWTRRTAVNFANSSSALDEDEDAAKLKKQGILAQKVWLSDQKPPYFMWRIPSSVEKRQKSFRPVLLRLDSNKLLLTSGSQTIFSGTATDNIVIKILDDRYTFIVNSKPYYVVFYNPIYPKYQGNQELWAAHTWHKALKKAGFNVKQSFWS